MIMAAYRQLLQEYAPRPIRSERAHRKALQEVDELMSRPRLSRPQSAATSYSASVISHPSPGPIDQSRRPRRRDNAASTVTRSPPSVAQTVGTAAPGPKLNVPVSPPVCTSPQSTERCDSITRRTAGGSSNPLASAAAKRSAPVEDHSQAMPGKSASNAARTSSMSPSERSSLPRMVICNSSKRSPEHSQTGIQPRKCGGVSRHFRGRA